MKAAAPWWTVTCCVCGEELPARGNKRVYVPWKRGFRLVHAEDCAGLIEAQGVLDVTPPKRKPLSPLLRVWCRQRVQAVFDLPKAPDDVMEDVLAVANDRLVSAVRAERLVSDEAGDEHDDLLEYCRELVRRLVHNRECAGQTGRLLA